VRRLTGDEDLTSEFATTWRTYDLDVKTTSLLEYAEQLTKAPGTIDDEHIDALRAAGWSEGAIYEASALISFFNFTGRMEAAAGLPPDEVPASARLPEARTATGAPRWWSLTRSGTRSGDARG
jgi:alkylhydroperoxidase family enzyme